MTIDKRTATNAELIEVAREDPAALYDAEYYEIGYSSEGENAYGRRDIWLQFFGNMAEQIKRNYKPQTTLDVGCAFGLLVEQLCDRGVDAYGIDVSPYAISQAREDMTDRLQVASILEPLPLQGGRKYDLITCIEVLEHLPPEQAEIAVKRLCEASDMVIFSSSDDDFDQITHFNVQPTENWLKLFADNGFLPAGGRTAPFISEQARVVARKGLGSRLLRWVKGR